MRIFFTIQTHFHDDYTRVLIDELAAQGDRVDLFLDLPEIPGDLTTRLPPTVRVARSRPVVWCGPSQVLALLDAIRAALEIEGWDMLVNLSGDSMLLRPIDELRAFLDASLAEGARALISHSAITRPFTRVGNDLGAPLTGRERGRRLVHTTPQVWESFLDMARIPLRFPERRFALDCSEGHDPKALFVTPATDENFERRREFYETSGLKFARAYYVLHRSICERLIALQDARDPVFDLFLSSFEPDETFMPSVLAHHLPDFTEVVAPNIVHHAGGERMFVDSGNIGQIASSGAFFVRKIDTSQWRDAFRRAGKPLPAER